MFAENVLHIVGLDWRRNINKPRGFAFTMQLGSRFFVLQVNRHKEGCVFTRCKYSRRKHDRCKFNATLMTIHTHNIHSAEFYQSDNFVIKKFTEGGHSCAGYGSEREALQECALKNYVPLSCNSLAAEMPLLSYRAQALNTAERDSGSGIRMREAENRPRKIGASELRPILPLFVPHNRDSNLP